ISDVKVPTLNVAGWWDQEDFYGPVRIYEALERHDTRNRNFLVVGPWNHGGWRGQPGDRLGAIRFDSATAKHCRKQMPAPWFAYFLKDRGKLDQAEALTFEAGSNRWRRWEAWPPIKNTEERRLYFAAGEKLSFEPPCSNDDTRFDQYISDPA